MDALHQAETARRAPAGFTVVELMVTCVIVGILAVAAVPNMHSYQESHRLWSQGEQLAAIARTAQSRARSQNHNVLVDYRRTDNVIAVVDDTNNNGVEDAGETESLHPVQSGLSLEATTFTSDLLVFDTHGRAVSAGVITLCGSGDSPQRNQVRIAAGTGIARVEAYTPD